MAMGVYPRNEAHKQQLIRARTFALTPEARKKNSESHLGHTPWNKGLKGVYTLSEESRRKMSAAHKGVNTWSKTKFGVLSPRWKGGLPDCSLCGKRLSVRHSKTGRCKRCAALLKTGTANNMWKGCITHLYMKIRHCTNYKDWRESVFKRDDYTCTSCKVRGGKLEADHLIPFYYIIEQEKIDSYEKALDSFMLWWPANGRTLCKPCHRNFPHHLIWKETIESI